MIQSLPSKETIAQFCSVRQDKPEPKASKPLSMKPSAVANRKLRAKYKAQGLNSDGKPYQRTIHPELRGLNNLNLYRKLWLSKRK